VKLVRRCARCLWRVRFEKEKVLRLARKTDGVMDGKSGDGYIREVR